MYLNECFIISILSVWNSYLKQWLECIKKEIGQVGFLMHSWHWCCSYFSLNNHNRVRCTTFSQPNVPPLGNGLGIWKSRKRKRSAVSNLHDLFDFHFQLLFPVSIYNFHFYNTALECGDAIDLHDRIIYM